MTITTSAHPSRPPPSAQESLLEEYRAASGRRNVSPEQLALEASRLGTWVLDFVAGELIVTPRFKEVLGYERGEEEWELGWDDLFSRMHPGDIDRVQSELSMHLDGLWPFDVECRFLSRQGERWFRLNGQADFDCGGRVVQMAGTIEDVTAMRQLELQLRESEQRFRSVFDASPEAMVITTNVGRVTLRNQVFDRFDPSDDPFDLPQEARASIAQEGRYGPLTLSLRRRDGSSSSVEMTGIELDATRILHVVRRSQQQIKGLASARSEVGGAVKRTEAALTSLGASRLAHLRRVAAHLQSDQDLLRLAKDARKNDAFRELTSLLAEQLEEQHRSLGEDLSRLRDLLHQLLQAIPEEE